MICLPLHRQRPQILNTSQKGPFNVIQLWWHKQEPPDLQLLLHLCLAYQWHIIKTGTKHEQMNQTTLDCGFWHTVCWMFCRGSVLTNTVFGGLLSCSVTLTITFWPVRGCCEMNDCDGGAGARRGWIGSCFISWELMCCFCCWSCCCCCWICWIVICCNCCFCWATCCLSCAIGCWELDILLWLINSFVWLPCGLVTTTVFCCCAMTGCWDESDWTTCTWDDGEGAFCTPLWGDPCRTFPAFPINENGH